MDKIYQYIGEYVVSFQWIENKIRTIGWFILDPNNENHPQKELREESSYKLFQKFEKLFLEALAKCDLPLDLENDFRSSLKENSELFQNIRKARNDILHSAYLELKAGGEIMGTMKSNSKLNKDYEASTNEMLTDKSFKKEMENMAILALFLNRCHMQLIQRYALPNKTLERNSLP